MDRDGARGPDGLTPAGRSASSATIPQPDEAAGAFLALIIDARQKTATDRDAWAVWLDPDHPPRWIHVHPDGAAIPAQGWKLHVSAGLTSAATVLCRTLPVLLRERAAFKVAASSSDLVYLNEGLAGLSQVGKFLTVYPRDDAQATQLAAALDEVTHGLRGPIVPSDRPLRPRSLVSYRYGAFTERSIETALGEIVPAIVAPGGGLVPDRRGIEYDAPGWVSDPFAAAGTAAEPATPRPMIGDRYLLLGPLHRSARGAVHLAVDMSVPRRCVVKQASRDATIDADGRDARDRLRREVEILAQLAADPRLPAVYDVIEQDGDLFVAMEDVEGETLAAHIARFTARGRLPPAAQIVAWGRELAALLGAIHAKGLNYRDLKSTNVIVAPDGGTGGGAPDRKGLGSPDGSPIQERTGGGAAVGRSDSDAGWGRDNAPNSKKRLRLIDFELADGPAAGAPFDPRHTRGYGAPQQASGGRATIAGDVYSLGALLYFLATGAEPTLAPREFHLLSRPLSLMNPELGPELPRAIARCLDPDPVARFPSMRALDSALAQTVPGAVGVPAVPARGPNPRSESKARRRCREQALRVGDALCRAALTELTEQRTSRPDGHLDITRTARGIFRGRGGAVLALAGLVTAFDDARHRAILAAAAQRLAEATRSEQQQELGLYGGEAAVGAALLRAGQALSDHRLITAAAERGRWIATRPYGSPDLLLGTAGRLRFHLMLWQETDEHLHLDHAVEAGKRLTSSAISDGQGGVHWPMPPGHGSLGGKAYLGYALGSAGIADTLLDLYEASGDPELLATVQGAAHRLARFAVPVLDDNSGLDWPRCEGETPMGATWCNGATGIGGFFLHAAQVNAVLEAAEVAARAARTTARGARWLGPTQCHGLAGNIEFLIDMYQATREQSYLMEARTLARLLEAFAVERDGALMYLSDPPAPAAPHYMVGYAGVASCLRRLADPDHAGRDLIPSRSARPRTSAPAPWSGGRTPRW